jgi:ubiquinone/menaquinone biosynthesis C-methylase UbiE
MPEAFWDEKASRGRLQAVLDFEDAAGRKNAYTDVLHKTAIERACRFEREDVVLDYGCGIGRLSIWVAPRVQTVHAVDTSEAMIERASSEASAAGIANVVFDRVRPFTALPLNDSSVDRVLCIWVLQHVLTDVELDSVLSELARVSKEGATLVFLERIADESKEPGMADDYIERRRPGGYVAAFQRAGFEVESIASIRTSSVVCRNRILNALVVRGILPSMFFPALAKLDLALQARTGGSSHWADTRFVCRRPLT